MEEHMSHPEPSLNPSDDRDPAAAAPPPASEPAHGTAPSWSATAPQQPSYEAPAYQPPVPAWHAPVEPAPAEATAAQLAASGSAEPPTTPYPAPTTPYPAPAAPAQQPPTTPYPALAAPAPASYPPAPYTPAEPAAPYQSPVAPQYGSTQQFGVPSPASGVPASGLPASGVPGSGQPAYAPVTPGLVHPTTPGAAPAGSGYPAPAYAAYGAAAGQTPPYPAATPKRGKAPLIVTSVLAALFLLISVGLGVAYVSAQNDLSKQKKTVAAQKTQISDLTAKNDETATQLSNLKSSTQDQIKQMQSDKDALAKCVNDVDKVLNLPESTSEATARKDVAKMTADCEVAKALTD
jgi:cell division protein FtsB